MSRVCRAPSEPWHWFGIETDDCGDAGADIRVDGGDLARGSEVRNAVLMQLLTDKGYEGRGGWWASYDLPFEPGSLLWRLRGRPRVDDEAIIDAERYVRDALDPLITYGLAARYEVDVRAVDGGMSIHVDLFDDAGQRVFNEIFPWVF